ncbi:unnamed protein product, partial [Choristocarpus tenellus]
KLLHCIEFDDSVQGGESTFMDAFEAARVFKATRPDMFEVLSRVPATFVKIRSKVESSGGR